MIMNTTPAGATEPRPAGTPPWPAPPQFTWNRDQAEAWLRACVAAPECAEQDGDALAGDLAGQVNAAGARACPEPYDDLLAGITEDWNPAEVGQEDTVRSLVSRAVDAGIIGTDGVLDLFFRYYSDDNGAYYCFLAQTGRLVLMSDSDQIEHVGNPGVRGIEAALAILEEAVRDGNRELAEFERHAAARAITLTPPAVQAAIARLMLRYGKHGTLGPAGQAPPGSDLAAFRCWLDTLGGDDE
jgi:hypothetical protein